MDHDDDVEHLFSWLQTPELRYREFAGAREITDTIVTWQARTNTAEAEATAPVAPRGNVQLAEEYPVDQFPDQSATVVEIIPEPVTRGPAMIAPMPPPAIEPAPSASPAGPFALGAAGRSPSRSQIEQPTLPSPLIQTPAPRQAAAPTPPLPRTSVVPPAPPPRPAVSTAGGGLLGGAYREAGANGHGADPGPVAPPSVPADSQQRHEQSLDAVFGRLSGRNHLPDPRDRLRHIPGLGPPAGRSR